MVTEWNEMKMERKWKERKQNNNRTETEQCKSRLSVNDPIVEQSLNKDGT